jgi:hypothetical protein
MCMSYTLKFSVLVLIVLIFLSLREIQYKTDKSMEAYCKKCAHQSNKHILYLGHLFCFCGVISLFSSLFLYNLYITNRDTLETLNINSEELSHEKNMCYTIAYESLESYLKSFFAMGNLLVLIGGLAYYIYWIRSTIQSAKKFEYSSNKILVIKDKI